MWQETKHGLYKKFTFSDFAHAWDFVVRAKQVMDEQDHHARWQNEWNVVEFWLITHDAEHKITDKDRSLAEAIDGLNSGAEEKSLATEDVQNTTNITEVQVYADGGSRGNPGPSASGFVVLDMQGNVIHAEGVYLGITTNNQAEYQALKLGLEAAEKIFHAETVHVYMDSLLVVNQMKRIFKVKNRDLWPIHDAINSLVSKFEKVEFTHVPRELNKLADAEVNKALDEELGIV